LSHQALDPEVAMLVERPETDRWLALVTALLVGGGLVMVLSSSQALAYLDHRFALYYFLRQAGSALLGFVLMMAFRRLDY
jgi:cell division protein FtsW (lipid II flippase)